MAITTLNNLSINRSDTAAADQVWTATSATASDFQAGGGGKIGQVVQGTLATATSTTATSFENLTGLVQAITPAATSSKIYITVNLAGINSSGANYKLFFKITGGNTASYVGADTGGGGDQCANLWTSHRADYAQDSINLNYLDSPSTTSETTYQVQWMCDGSTNWINRSNTDNAETGYTMSSITCMEVLV